MTNILFTNTNCSCNKGSAAQIISTKKILEKYIPEANFLLLSQYPSLNAKYCNTFGIQTIKNLWADFPLLNRYGYLYFITIFPLINILLYILFKLGLNHNILKNSTIKAYIDADIIIDLSGDSYLDKKGFFSFYLSSNLLLAIALKKPIILYSQTIGPFKKILVPFNRFCLNKVNLIMVREKITKSYLEKIEIKSDKIKLMPDCAFVLDSEPPIKIQNLIIEDEKNNKKPIVGISLNVILDSLNKEYTIIMAQTIDYLIKKYDVQVILVPHVIIAHEGCQQDDRDLGKKICNFVNEKNNIILLNDDYSPEELKGIIGLSTIFIGGRMHANIAALSNNIPTIAISWNNKYEGIMKDLKQEKYVIQLQNLNVNDLKSKIDDLWINKELIQIKLKLKTDEMKMDVIHSGKNIIGILNSSR